MAHRSGENLVTRLRLPHAYERLLRLWREAISVYDTPNLGRQFHKKARLYMRVSAAFS